MSKRSETHEPVSLNFPIDPHLEIVARAAAKEDLNLSHWIIRAAVRSAAEVLGEPVPDTSQFELPERQVVAAAAAAQGLTVDQFMAKAVKEAVRSSLPPAPSVPPPSETRGLRGSGMSAAQYVAKLRGVAR
jgi:uncharacterized protein (DUF1778 family)